MTNIDPVCFKFFTKDNPIYEYVSNNMVDMDNKEILDKHFKDKMPEIYVDFSDNGKGKLFIDVHFNKTLSDERKLKESNTNPYSRNVLLLYIDSLSRANAMRQLKKTLNFFERFMSYKGGFNEKYPSEIFHSFQFFKSMRNILLKYSIVFNFLNIMLLEDLLFSIILYSFMGKKGKKITQNILYINISKKMGSSLAMFMIIVQ